MNNDLFLRKHLLEYFEKGKELSFGKDEIILRPYEESGGVYMLLSGFVSAYTITNYGETNLLVINKPGELFPLASTLRGLQSSLYRQAKTDVVLRRVSRAAFLSSMSANNIIANAVNRQLLDLAAIYEDRVKQLEFRTARERVMASFYIMSTRYGQPHADGILLAVPITHQDIADMLNMTRETASREIERLVRQGVIQQVNRQIIIRNLTPLKALFD